MRSSLFVVLLLVTTPVLAQHGYLQVRVSPSGAQITVNDITSVVNESGDAIEYWLAPGSYDIVARKAGYTELTQTAKVEAGQLTAVTLNLLSSGNTEYRPSRELPAVSEPLVSAQVGDIQVKSSPANQPVYLNGRERQLRTPMEISGMQIGTYTVRTGNCEVTAPVQEDMIVSVECINGVATLSYTSTAETQQAPMIAYPAFAIPVEGDFGTGRGGRKNSNRNYDDEPGLAERPMRGRKTVEIGMGIGGFEAVTGSGDSETGFGVDLIVGYGLSERFALGVNGAVGVVQDLAADDGFAVTSVGGLFGRLFFGGVDSRTRPYFTFGGGLGRYKANMGGTEIKSDGFAGTAGFGLDHVTSGAIGFFLEVNYHAINFENVIVGDTDQDILVIDLDYIVFTSGLRFRF